MCLSSPAARPCLRQRYLDPWFASHGGRRVLCADSSTVDNKGRPIYRQRNSYQNQYNNGYNSNRNNGYYNDGVRNANQNNGGQRNRSVINSVLNHVLTR